MASRKSSPLSRRSPRERQGGRLGETGNAPLIDSEGNAPIVPEDGEIGADFVLEDRHFLDDKKCQLTRKNRILGSATPDMFVIDAHADDCRRGNALFCITLDLATQTHLVRFATSPHGGGTFFIVLKTRDLRLERRYREKARD